MTGNQIAPAYAIAHVWPEFLDSLSPEEMLCLPYMYDLLFRPDQRIPNYDWTYLGFIAGRGWGKSIAIAPHINGAVERGDARSIALMAPTVDRVEDVQIKFLVDTAPPWFRPERYKGGLVWPNGVRALPFTPEAPGRTRSENLDYSWLCEIVDWNASTRREAFDNITTATRVGRARVLWDTTSKGKNDIILHLLSLNAQDPRAYPIMRGTTFDNPLLGRKYLASECRKYVRGSRRYQEEIEGMVFAEAAGALLEQAWLDTSRRYISPDKPRIRLVSIDPALSKRSDADETGLLVGCSDNADDAYVERDLSGRMSPEEWGDKAIHECADNNAAGAIVERNHLGDNASFVLRARAATRGLTTHVIPRTDKREFPRRKPGVVYIREHVAASSKSSRASGPAVETEAGRVHIVGHMPELENQLTTWEPGTGQPSPNRLDAWAYLVIELRGLAQTAAPRTPVLDVQTAAKAHSEIVNRLRAAGAGRRVGL